MRYFVCIVFALARVWLLTKFYDDIRTKFKVPYLNDHLVSVLGQCDTNSRKLNWIYLLIFNLLIYVTC